MSDGRIYCFINPLRELSDRYDRASVIHIGAGFIQTGYRLHEDIYVREGPFFENSAGSARIPVMPLRTSITTALLQDITSPELDIKVVIEDSIKLRFLYQISSRRMSREISPTLLTRWLLEATEYKVLTPNSPPILFKRQQVSRLNSGVDQIPPTNIYTADGEGSLLLQEREFAPTVIVWPHSGNILGRCLAVTMSPGSTALLYQKEDLETFARFYNYERAKHPDTTTNWTLT